MDENLVQNISFVIHNLFTECTLSEKKTKNEDFLKLGYV